MSSFLIILVIVVIFVIMMFILSGCKSSVSGISEPFDATGYVMNIPPPWFIKQDYNLNNWIVRTYNDAIESNCMPYSRASKYGSLENINYDGSAYKFWRF